MCGQAEQRSVIFFEAIFATQLTVGELLLNKATCLCAMSGATPSRHSHNRNNPTISSSELLMHPLGLLKDTRSTDMSAGHGKQKIVGGIDESSPTMTPPHARLCITP